MNFIKPFPVLRTGLRIRYREVRPRQKRVSWVYHKTVSDGKVPFWISGEYKVPLHCDYSQVPSGPEYYYLFAHHLHHKFTQ